MAPSSGARHIATLHVACGFPALRAPAHFSSRVMRPILLERLQRPTDRTTRGTPEKRPSVSDSHSLLHSFQPKPRRWHARLEWTIISRVAARSRFVS